MKYKTSLIARIKIARLTLSYHSDWLSSPSTRSLLNSDNVKGAIDQGSAVIIYYLRWIFW